MSQIFRQAYSFIAFPFCPYGGDLKHIKYVDRIITLF